MNKIMQSTNRGQITLPKTWRDKFDTSYFMAEISENEIIIRPLTTPKNFKNEVENSWQEYLDGDFTEGDELMKEYGL